MKNFLVLLFIVGFISTVSAQLQNHIKWQVTTETISENEAEIHYKATLDPTWHIWSQNPGDEMLVPPTFTIDKSSGVTPVGTPREVGKKIKKVEEGFDNPLYFYEGTVDFVQKVKFNNPTKVSGKIEYQICDPKSCLPPNSEDFKVEIKPFEKSGTTITDAAIPSKTNTADSLAALNKTKLTEEVAIVDSSTIEPTLDQNAEIAKLEAQPVVDYGIFGTPLQNCNVAGVDKLNRWTAFLAGILGGFLALFFPCTFPMIPMTMSFFLKGSKTKKEGISKAILYGFSIFLVYLLLSLPFSLLGWSSDTLNDLSTNPWLNLFMFVIFVYFAFSLFGFYDISLPSSVTNKIDSKSNLGSYFGIFFMALTLAIVSFSCTGPILGLVLGNLKNAELITPAMAGFGIGLGVPFALFAIFPNLLSSLPKSGSWLNVIKVVFGFIELAFAFKFLSNADLVNQWGIMKRETFVIIWMIIFALMGLYLVGVFKIHKGDSFKKTPITYGLAILSFMFVGYLATDFFGGDLKLISGFPPPKSYSISTTKSELHIETNNNNYDAALAKADAEGKLLMIDFTGWACVNCRKMEENVWINPRIYDILQNKYVITSLYVDEKIELPKEEQYFSKSLNKQIVTVGNKWTDFEVSNMHQVTQPLYAIIDPKTKRIVNTPVGGYMSVDDYEAFLNCALSYQKKLAKNE